MGYLQSDGFWIDRSTGGRPRRAFGSLIAGLVLTSALSSPACAQASGNPQASDKRDMDAIVVTARRRAEAAQDVPISIIAVDQEALSERSIRNAVDLPLVAPGLSVSSQSGRTGVPLYSIRGQYQAFGGTGPGVVVYLADVPDFATQIYDLDSVQVLKGPQGTLFGRNSTGGAILLNPAKPTSELGGFVTLRTGSRERTDAEFALGGGTSNGVIAARIAGQYLHANGYTFNLGDGTRMDNENRISLRGSVLFRPAEWLENYTLFQYTDRNEQGAGLQIAGINGAPHSYSAINPFLREAVPSLPFDNPPGTIILLPQVQAQLAAQRARGPRTIDIDGPHGEFATTWGLINSTTVSLDDNISVKNIFSWRRTRGNSFLDYDGTNLPLAHDAGSITNGKEVSRSKQVTEEVQVQGSWDFVDATLGFYQENARTPLHTFIRFTQFQPFPAAVAGVPQGPLSAYIKTFSIRKSHAFYGQATIRPFEGFSLTGGIRRTRDIREGGGQTALLLPGLGLPEDLLPLGPLSSSTYTGSATTWNVDALYQIDPNFNFYAGIRRGYRAGGVNGTTVGAGNRYLPEFVTDYEAGIKFSGMIGSVRVRANVDVFFDDYKNIQRAVTNPGTVNSRTVNAAAGETWGADFDLMIAQGDRASLQVTYSLLNTKYTDYMDAVFGDISKGLFPGAPKHQLVIVPRVVPVSDKSGEVVLQAFAYYQSRTTHDVFNSPNGNPYVAEGVNGSIVPGYWKVDLRADWNNIMGSNLGVSAFVKNVFDKAYVTSTANLQPTGPSYVIAYAYGEPRAWGLEMRYRF